MIVGAWRQLARGATALLRRQRTDADIDDEVAHYLAEAEAAHRATGGSTEAARRAAVLEVGGALQVRERVRSYGWENLVEAFAQDCRLALRRLCDAPVFTGAIVLTLAVGIGAATAIVSAARPVLLDPLPYPDASRILVIRELNADGSYGAGTFGMQLAFAERSREFEAVAALLSWQPTLAGDSPERLEGQRVSAAYFDVLGVAPRHGRGFVAADDRANATPVVILSNALWQSRFAGDPAVTGHTIRLDDVAHTVIGVMPADFENVLAPAAELWAPLQYDISEGRAWGHHLHTIGRLRQGVEPAAAVRELNAIAGDVIATERPPTYSPDGGVMWVAPSLRDDVTRSVRPAMIAMLGAVALLLVMTCVNATNLLLGRSIARQPELALRLVLGADRRRIARQMLTESLVLALPAGVLGVFLALSAVRALVALAPTGLPRVHAIGVDTSALLFAIVITLGIALLLGTATMMRGEPGPAAAWHAAARLTTGPSGRRLRAALIVTQIAIALMLLVGSGLLLRSLQRLFAVPPGFDATETITLQIHTAGLRYRDDTAARRFFADVLGAAASVPGVRSAALTSQLPLSGDADEWGVHFENINRIDENRSTFRYAVSSDYFATMRIPLLRGRLLTERDVSGTPFVAVISESLARQRFPGGDAIGRRLRIGPPDSEPYTVVGVVGDVTQQSLAIGPSPAVYVTTAQWRFADRAMTLVVRAHTDPDALVPALRAALTSVDRDQPVTRVARLANLVTNSVRAQRFAWLVFQVFGMAALLLAAAGLYGVVAGSMAERTREIGVRAALGADRAALVTLILAQGLRLTAVGIAIGLAGAVAASRMVDALLFGITHNDPPTYAAVVLLLLAMSLVACGVPAWRAARVDPASTLRT